MNSLSYFHDFSQARLSYSITIMTLNSSMFYLALASRLEGHTRESLVFDSIWSVLTYKLVSLAKFAWSQWTAKCFTSCKRCIRLSIFAIEMQQLELFSVARRRIKGSLCSHFNCFHGLNPQSTLSITLETLKRVFQSPMSKIQSS